MRFRPEIVAATRKTFKRVAKKMEVPVKKLTFVGVHNRLDLLHFLKNNILFKIFFQNIRKDKSYYGIKI